MRGDKSKQSLTFNAAYIQSFLQSVPLVHSSHVGSVCGRVYLTPTLCFSMFLIHLMACPWGSTISGQRLLLVTITPFSVEKESEGRPLMFQSRTLDGSARKEAKAKSGDEGMASSFTWGGWVQGHEGNGGDKATHIS